MKTRVCVTRKSEHGQSCNRTQAARAACRWHVAVGWAWARARCGRRHYDFVADTGHFDLCMLPVQLYTALKAAA
eukprot:618654-Prymnesium_polylepis.1